MKALTPPLEQYTSPLLATACQLQPDSWRIVRKIENAPAVLSKYNPITTTYRYDDKGHLTQSATRYCNEDYAYNSIGQRIFMLHTRKGVFNYSYNAQGKLTQVNATRFKYDPLGRLSRIAAFNAPAKLFMYERVRIGKLDVDRLAAFQDSTGKSYTYSYTPDNPLPIAVHSYGQPLVSYQWEERDGLPRLLSCITNFAKWHFGYLEDAASNLLNLQNLPVTVTLTGPAVAHLGYWDLKSLQCKLGYDHLGTVKLIADPFNGLVKELEYDSFGNIISETEPSIYFPFGFAGGLRDIVTGFVCFGYRDYDPTVGRFTTQDPALDMRGDGDIYDYCVDDPVNLVDAEGLAFGYAIGKVTRKRAATMIKAFNSLARTSRGPKKVLKQSPISNTSGRSHKTIETIDVSAPSANFSTGDFSLDDLLNSAAAGMSTGGTLGQFLGPVGKILGQTAGAAFGVLTSNAAKSAHSKIQKFNIDAADSTSINIQLPSLEPEKPVYIEDPISLRTGKVPSGGKCTASNQPRTPDGRFASCGHA